MNTKQIIYNKEIELKVKGEKVFLLDHDISYLLHAHLDLNDGLGLELTISAEIEYSEENYIYGSDRDNNRGEKRTDIELDTINIYKIEGLVFDVYGNEEQIEITDSNFVNYEELVSVIKESIEVDFTNDKIDLD